MKARMAFVFCFLGFTFVFSPDWGEGADRVRHEVSVSTVRDAETEASVVVVELQTIGTENAQGFLTAVLEFEASDLSPGDEVELWLGSESELPWARPEADLRRADIWIADERTENLIRFDLTRILRGILLAHGELPHLYVRRAPDDEGVVPNLTLSSNPEARFDVRSR